MDPTNELRIWRLRKRNLYVDAELRQVPDSGEWDLLIYYGTTLTSSRRCATRAEAVGEAFDIVADDFLHRLLVAGGAGRDEQILQELVSLRFHRFPFFFYSSSIPPAGI